MPASFAGFSMGVSHLPSHIISITGSESHQGVPSNRIPGKSLHVGQCLRTSSLHLDEKRPNHGCGTTNGAAWFTSVVCRQPVKLDFRAVDHSPATGSVFLILIATISDRLLDFVPSEFTRKSPQLF